LASDVPASSRSGSKIAHHLKNVGENPFFIQKATVLGITGAAQFAASDALVKATSNDDYSHCISSYLMVEEAETPKKTR
jgi:hypothetical protein